MRNKVLRIAGKHWFLEVSQLCNSLLHNWDLNTQSHFWKYYDHPMKGVVV